ncbi:hypothetical protein NL533_34910, partial [Klebsiella pneumoniae]|nr:hypothetical protein [Klebsiella pneumoniae]
MFLRKGQLRGQEVDYGIFFGIKRTERTPNADLQMYIESAYFLDFPKFNYYNPVRFSHLVRLRMEHKTPN